MYKLRPSIGHTPDTPTPPGLNWDRFLGPAPMRPFNEKRFAYYWHWFWDSGNGDIEATAEGIANTLTDEAARLLGGKGEFAIITGALSAAGKSGLLALEIWRDDVNAKGGLLGRPVKLVYYDDQSNPATVPGIYTKLLDVAVAVGGDAGLVGAVEVAARGADGVDRGVELVAAAVHAHELPGAQRDDRAVVGLRRRGEAPEQARPRDAVE